ncbi:radical SAM protein [Nocardioides sp. HB32]
MTMTHTDSSSAVLTLPIEVHVFEHLGTTYAFDARNFTILRPRPVLAEVLRRAATAPLDVIESELAESFDPLDVRQAYLEAMDLLDNGTLSSTPPARPRRPPFSHLVVMLAGGCNMGCTYCFEKDVPIYQEKNLMTRERADEVLDWFFRHQEGDSAHIQLYGGEPMLNWPILQHVVERAEAWATDNEKTLTKYLITNGTLLVRDRIRWLRDHAVTIQVSVDGDEGTHDVFRVFKNGKGTIDNIKGHIRELGEEGADFNLRAVVTRQRKDPAAIVEGLRSYGADQVSFEVVATDSPAARFTEADWAEFNAGYDEFVHNPQESWSLLPDDMKSVIIKICSGQKVFYGCGAGISEVTVSPDGSIYECQRIYRTPYSSIFEDTSPTDLGSTLLTMVDDRPVCRDCWARYLCGGGCMHQSHTEGTEDPLPEYCTMKRNLVEASVIAIGDLRSRLIEAEGR